MGGVVCARGESEKSQLRRKLKKKDLFLVCGTFLSPCAERFSTTERDVNASTEWTELREKNLRSRLSFRGECRKDLTSGCSRGSCEVETLWFTRSEKHVLWMKLLFPNSICRERTGGLADSRKTRNACWASKMFYILFHYFQQRLHLTQEGNNKAINTKEMIKKKYLSSGAVQGFGRKGNLFIFV